MNHAYIKKMLEQVASGSLTPEDALTHLHGLFYDDVGFAKIDFHRHLRKGYPETIFCLGKTADQVAAIAHRMFERGENVLGTRCTADVFQSVQSLVPEAVYHEHARAFTILTKPPTLTQRYVALVCAGTGDIPVAEEAAITLFTLGIRVERIYDVGVAGIHRLFDQLPVIREASVVLVCAGMEGALPSVVAGLTASLVIGVPTSVGYGASFSGIAALLGMLNSCSTGLTVVNIDNGFGAAMAAGTIIRTIEPLETAESDK